ncbi:MAG: hypothetical protein ACRCVV_14760 [Shewanella sp.]|uniref:hypothetical protein n=1 Tax=Aeromonas popoffii TaxID=70856 RepID=UPI003F2B15C4
MIDLDSIEAQCKSSIANGYGHLPVIDCGNAVKVMELITRLRQAEKDAARYRWLRDKASAFAIENAAEICREAWDSLIDDAMNARNGGDL